MADRKEIRVFISSPGDCNPERDAVGRVLDEMNRTSGERAGLFFNAVRWQDLPPGVGRNPQAVIDEELGAYNVLVGLMWMRFGTPIPGGANSGTEHEVERAIESWARVGKPRVMFYFKQGSPEDLTLIDPEQLQKVKEFRKRLQQVALVQDFHETAEFESKLRIHLNRLIDHLRCSPSDQHVVPESISKLPYGDFDRDFREVVAPVKIRDTGGLLHVVFGNIADVHSIPVVIPMGQAFDFWQRGPRSVLAAFETIRVGGRLFFDDLEQRWPRDQRPRAAGLGQTKYLKLPKNTQNLPGIMLVVTTRDLSTSKKHYGLYVNTPIEGVAS